MLVLCTCCCCYLVWRINHHHIPHPRNITKCFTISLWWFTLLSDYQLSLVVCPLFNCVRYAGSWGSKRHYTPVYQSPQTPSDKLHQSSLIIQAPPTSPHCALFPHAPPTFIPALAVSDVGADRNRLYAANRPKHLKICWRPGLAVHRNQECQTIGRRDRCELHSHDKHFHITLS